MKILRRTQVHHNLCRSAAFLFLGLAAGCATKGSLQVTSNPEGSRVQIQGSGQTVQEGGETPVNLPEGVLKSIHGDTIQVKVTKEGYLPESMVIPKATLASRSNLHFKLTENTLSKACEQKLGAIEAVSRGIAKAQSLTAKKNYERAEAVLLELQEDYPSLSVVYDLLGNVYYLQKNLGKALMAYEKSHELWPNNLETERMIRKLERSVSGSR